MTVNELIKELKAAPRKLEVTFSDQGKNYGDGEQLLISPNGVEVIDNGDGDKVVVIFRRNEVKTRK